MDSNATIECLASLLDPLLLGPLNPNENLGGLQMVVEALTSLSVLLWPLPTTSFPWCMFHTHPYTTSIIFSKLRDCALRQFKSSALDKTINMDML